MSFSNKQKQNVREKMFCHQKKFVPLGRKTRQIGDDPLIVSKNVGGCVCDFVAHTGV